MPKIKVNGVSLYYELHGSKNRPVLVLNNGIIMNASTSWIFQTSTLSKKFRVIQYDCRGQGKSDHPCTPYSMELHADDLAMLLEKLEIKEAHIAGISYGGEVAQAFALNYPQKTKSLILIDTVSEIGPKLKLVIKGWVDALESENPSAFFNVTVPWNFSSDWIKNNPEILEKAKERYKHLDFPAVINLCNAFFNVDYTDRLTEIQSPTCVMVGELDLIKGLPYAKILKKGIPHAEFHILEGSGHASCWERPEEFNSIIMGFLTKLSD